MDFAAELGKTCEPAFDADLDFQHIARDGGTEDFRPADGGESQVGEGRDFWMGLKDDAAELGDGFKQDDAGHHGVAGKMSFEKRLVAAHGVSPAAFDTGIEGKEFVDKTKRRTMREGLQGGLKVMAHESGASPGSEKWQAWMQSDKKERRKNPIDARPIPDRLAKVEINETSAPLTPAASGASLHWWLRAPWDYTMMALGLLYWGVFGGLLTLIGGPLHGLMSRQRGQRLGRAMIHQLFRKFVVYLRCSDLVQADLSGLDALRTIRHPFIAAPNHTSLWDVVFIIARLPRAVCVMKKCILMNPLLGGGARLAGYIANDGVTRMIRDASASLNEDGGQLLLFPEGTRTREDARWINPLKGGCAIIAAHAGVPVYPIFIRSNTRFLQKGWPLWRRPVFPIEISFNLGEPLHVEAGETAQDFTARLTAVYETELAKPHRLRRQLDSGNS